ncbi:hypothetical protein GJAV_G00034590 [Gymnothorax javanicus]|nr:hypothetical protein GJAV_G00034590 [Gymnothorax javanicus]
MDDIYPYPVFIECHNLLEEQKKKIENYFRIRRRSGGGDCGPLRSVDHEIYRIAFKYEEDQQKVLRKSEHCVDGLVFTVRDSLEPQTTSNISTSQAVQDSTAPVQSPQSPVSTCVPSGEEYELQLDSNLLRYLEECPEAWNKLENELTFLACSAQLYTKEGRVLVRSLARPGAVDEAQNWKAEVDKLFDSYMCHYEVDPHKIETLLLSSCSRGTSDVVKVYSEFGVAVVVGKCSQVKSRLMEVEDRSDLSEKQIKICQLGEAKLRLLWEEIEHRLGLDFPEMKVTREDAGQLVLEGSLKEILEAGDWISEKENLVLERSVSDVSPHLLAFLKKAYGGPGVLGELLEVGDKVEMELRDTELHFFSLSSDDLDKTEKALQDEIKEVKIDVPDCSAVLAELCEKLLSKTNEMNRGQYRAQVVFGSDSTVHLLGHAKEVEELFEVVAQFILDHSATDPLEKVRSPTRKDEQVNVEQDLASLSLSEVNTTVASYSLPDGLQVLICLGDITKQDADALVNDANEDLDLCRGVAAALSKAGGPEVQRECDNLVKNFGKIPPGEVVVTTGGNLNCKVLLHSVGPVDGKAGGRERFLLKKAVHSALNLSEIMEFQSIAMPCISSGVGGVSANVCSKAIVTAVREFGSQGARSLSRIILIDSREEAVRAMHEACERLLLGINTTESAPSDLGYLMNDSPQDDTSEGVVRLEVIQGMIEAQQVDALVSPMVGHDPLSTRVGNTLYKIVGPQLTEKFRKEAGEESVPGDTVLVECDSTLPSNAVIFLNLVPWDNDQDGTAVQVLRMGINKILTSCENRGLGSVALPVLGAGIALRFPDSVVARVLQEEVCAFEKNRAGQTPFLVRIVIHPNDNQASEAFKPVQEAFQRKGSTEDFCQPDQVSTTRRLVLLGKTGSGKSSLANTIFGEELFLTYDSPNSGTRECQAETKSVNRRSITVIDTPGFFDSERSEDELKSEIVRCITECAPGPHAFLIVLKVDKFTEHEQAVITKICQYFSEDALKYAVIVFTHGNQLPEGMKIEEFVSQNKNLRDLVRKCRGRCHVFDNKYWQNNLQNDYRNNQFQVEDLLNTIDKMVMENNGGYYINKMLKVVEEELQKEEELMRRSSGNMSAEEIREQAKAKVSDRFLIQLAGTATGAVLGALFGVAAMVKLVITALQNPALMKVLKMSEIGGAVAAVGGAEVAIAAGFAVGVAAGGVIGGKKGHEESEKAQTPLEAATMAATAVINEGNATLKTL